ncbi:MAG: hypothetical protein F4018_00650 [Acidobacteria bacterium]|nr:hypothetical protein [Acidobacteriota bacterium]MYH28821.1 hypothetical protein [Acidobacteriota bacterium]MYK86971.1 hypothetical protein [Acidobacteriota bacterium]
MLIELLVSVGIVLGLLGIVFALVDPSGGALAVQSLTADVHQRQRTTLGEIHRHLLLAGSGPLPGANGVVAHLRPAVAPALRGAAVDSAPGVDRVSVLYAVPGASGARLAGLLAGSPAGVRLLPVAGCTLPCGLTERSGGLAVVYDATGRSDLYRVTELEGADAVLERLAGGGGFYGAGSLIVPVLVRGYYHDADAEQLRLHNGAGSDLPVVDGVVDFAVRYFGVAQPTLPPPVGPAAVTAPCLAAAAAAEAPASGVGVLSPALLSDGASCAAGGTPFDVDLFRIRRVRVEVTLRAADAARRLPATGSPLTPVRNAAVRDVVAGVDVAPRSLAGW